MTHLRSAISWFKQPSHFYLLLFVVIFAAAGTIFLFLSSASTPTTTLKTPIQGILDRGSLGSANNGADYNFPSGTGTAALNGVVANVSWAQLQPTQGGPIDSNNQLNTVLTAVSNYNQSNPSQHLEVKLRIFAGIYAPDWAKTLDGWNPVNICNNQGSPCGTIGPYWTSDYDNAYKSFMTELASTTDSLGNTFDNEPLLHDVTISQCMTTFAEPFQRDDSNFGQVLYPTSTTDPQPNFTGSAYSPQNDENCLLDQIDNSTAWKHTNLSLSFNPFKPWTSASTQDGNSPYGEAFTKTVMDHCRVVLGAQCTIENNSIRDSYVGQQNTSGNLYYDITGEGPDITFQTAAPGSVGSIVTTVDWAAQMGANAVELPSNYNTLSLSQLDSLSSALIANPINPITDPSPTITSIDPSSGSTNGGTVISIGVANFPSGNPSSVTFGGTVGTAVSRSGNTVSVTTPAHAAGSVTVEVNIGGDSASTSYTYETPPPTQLPDLIIQSLVVNPIAPSVSDHVLFSMVVKNQGAAAVPSGTAITGEFLIDGTKVTWEDNYTNGLAVGDTATLSNNQGLNGNDYWAATAGNHTLEGDVNYQNTISESNLSNNTFSEALDIAEPPVPQAPQAPTNISSPSQTSTSINLTWTASVPGTNGDPASELTYHINRNGTEVGHTAQGQTSYTDTSLSPSTTYSYTIFATDTASRSSNDSDAFTQATAGLDCATPPAPGSLTASASSDGTSVALQWDVVSAVAPCTIAQYLIQEDNVVIAQLNSTSYTVTDLTPATSYAFSVIAVTNDNKAGNPATASVTTPSITDTTPPTAPTDVVAIPVSSTQINLTWSASTDPKSGIKLYEIERNAQVIGTTTFLSFGDSGLTPGTTYNYVVVAENGATPTLSTASAQVTATTLPGNNGGSPTSTTTPSSPILENTTSVGSGTDATNSATSGSSMTYNPTSSNPVSDNPTAANTTPDSTQQTINLGLAAHPTDAFVGSGLIICAPLLAFFYLRSRMKTNYAAIKVPVSGPIDFATLTKNLGNSRLTPGTIINPDTPPDKPKEGQP